LRNPPAQKRVIALESAPRGNRKLAADERRYTQIKQKSTFKNGSLGEIRTISQIKKNHQRLIYLFLFFSPYKHIRVHLRSSAANLSL
jgi:hypothetical protein